MRGNASIARLGAHHTPNRGVQFSYHSRSLRPGSGCHRSGKSWSHCTDCRRRQLCVSKGDVVATPSAAAGATSCLNNLITVITPVREPLPFAMNKKEIKANQSIFLDHAVLLIVTRSNGQSIAGCRSDAELPRDSGPARLHRDPDTEIGCLCHGKRRQCVSGRLLWPGGLSGAKSSVLQANHGRRFDGYMKSARFRAEKHSTIRHI